MKLRLSTALVALSSFASLIGLAAACSTTTHVIEVTDEGGASGDGSSHDAGKLPDGGGGDGNTSSEGGPTTCVPVTGLADGGPGACGSVDAGPPPPPSDSGAACVALSSVGSFQPSYKPPSGAHQGKCTQKQMDDFRNFCLGTGDTQACQSFLATAEGKTCAQCILTQPTAATLGPLIDNTSQGYVTLNTAGCIALLEPCNETCAKSIVALAQCDNAACINCKVTDPTSLQELNACTAVAETCACSSYVQPASCADQLKGGDHPAAACLSGNDFTSGYNVLAPLFCGP